MVPGLFVDPTSRALRTALSGLQLRQQTIANNIANVDTPNYKAQKVSFEDHLQAELAGRPRESQVVGLGLSTTHSRHIPVDPKVRTFEPRPFIEPSDVDGTLRNDGNTVDVDREMTSLAETQVIFGALTQLTGAGLARIRTAINEGRR